MTLADIIGGVIVVALAAFWLIEITLNGRRK